MALIVENDVSKELNALEKRIKEKADRYRKVKSGEKKSDAKTEKTLKQLEKSVKKEDAAKKIPHKVVTTLVICLVAFLAALLFFSIGDYGVNLIANFKELFNFDNPIKGGHALDPHDFVNF